MTSEQDRNILKDVKGLPEIYPYLYIPEKFTPEEEKILLKFFTNTDKPVFAIFGLSQEVVGALFSRYSRTDKSVRRLFLEEFWQSTGQESNMEVAKERASSFYKKVFAEFGDDSVIQMGSVHVAFEYVSQIAAKAIEDQRIGAAYMERSTRYVKFDSTSPGGRFLSMEPPEIMDSHFGEEFISWNNRLFEAYKEHIPEVVEHMRTKYPIEDQEFLNSKSGETIKYAEMNIEDDKTKAQKAYEKALLAKSLDTIRIFLPTTTVTNLGAHFSGQAAENAINKMLSSPYSEVRLLGLMAYQELVKVTPGFLQNIGRRSGEIQRAYLKEVREGQERTASLWTEKIEEKTGKIRVRLVDWDRDADIKIAAQILYKNQQERHLSKRAILNWCRNTERKELARIISESVPDRKLEGRTRRQKVPRAFESAFADVEFYLDFGVYRDLQRNRMASTERQALSAEEVHIPEEYYEPGMEKVLEDYLELSELTRGLHRRILASSDPNLARAAEYVTILGNKLRFNVRANIRQWVFFAELRTIEGGHKTYRQALQSAARQILYVMPFLKPLFAHVNWKKDYGLGRLKAEFKTQKKLEEMR